MRISFEIYNNKGETLVKEEYPTMDDLPSPDDVVEEWPLTGVKCCVTLELTPEESEAINAKLGRS